MSVVVPHRAIERVSLASDPKKAIFDIVGDLSGVHLMADTILIGTYIRPQKTAGGIIRPDMNVAEDVWQGKAGLVLKLGPAAFQDTTEYSFGGDTAEVGDWVVYKVGDAWSLNIKGYPCRLLRDVSIRLKVDDPSIVF
jgi:co-chaperonin GroES (HSP10)